MEARSAELLFQLLENGNEYLNRNLTAYYLRYGAKGFM